MSNKVLLKKSSVVSKVPLTTDLDYGELALNYADGKLYFKNSSNVIKSFTLDDNVVTLAGTQTLTNKTLTSPTINGGALSGTFSGSATLSGAITLSNTTASTSTSTGALTIGGGLGVAGAIYADQIRLTNNGNGTNVYVGDDVRIGDINTANTLGIRGLQDSTKGYIVFGDSNGTAYIGRDGTNPITVYGGQFVVNGSVNNGAAALQLTGYASKGGTGYHDFLSVTNTYGSATNANKYFRLNTTGQLEIINSAYTANIFTLTDAGVLSVPQISAGGSTGTNGQVLSSTGTGLQWISVGGTGTVTSITAGTGLTGGTITSSGTIALSNTTVTAGSYGSATAVPVITVDAQGRITAASTSTISGSLTFTGDVTGTGSTGSSTALTLANSGVVAGTYTKITVDAKGRATAGASATTTDISEGTNLYYTSARANSDFDTRLATKTTTNLAEGTNLYYTDTRARAAHSAGTGISYNSTTGVISTSQDISTAGSPTFAGLTTTGNASVGGSLTITGDLTVNGTTTTVNSTTVTVDDKNIELGSVTTPTNITADGGGITLKGTTDKTFNWVNATSAWTSSEHLALASGKNIILNGGTSGSITLTAIQIAGSNTITFPATTGNVITSGDSGTVTNSMLFGLIANNKLANSTISGVSLGSSLNALSVGSGLSLSSGTTYDGSAALTISHADTSSAANLTASARTYVTGLTFDTFGHVTGYTTGTETVVDTNTTYSISAETATGGVNLRLTGSDSSTDDVKIAAGANITVTRTDASTITIESTAAGGGSTPWLFKTANYTAAASDRIIATTTSGGFTITLPATPSQGDEVIIADGDNWQTNNLTVNRNGSTIKGLAENLVMDIAGVKAEFVYSGSTWLVFAFASGADDTLATSLAIGDEF